MSKVLKILLVLAIFFGVVFVSKTTEVIAANVLSSQESSVSTESNINSQEQIDIPTTKVSTVESDYSMNNFVLILDILLIAVGIVIILLGIAIIIKLS